MRAYLIDPKDETITEVDYSDTHLDINRHIDCEKFTIVEINPGADAVFVDAGGLLNNPRYFFTLAGYPQPLPGKGLVLGIDDDGESTEPAMTIGDLKAMVRFVQLSYRGVTHSAGDEDTPYGRMHVLRSTPIFGPPDQGED